MAKKVEVPQDVDQRTVDPVFPTPQEVGDSVAEVFKQTTTERPPERLPESPEAPPATAGANFPVQRDTTDNQPEKIPETGSQGVLSVSSTPFRGEVSPNEVTRQLGGLS